MKKCWTGKEVQIEYDDSLTGDVKIIRAYSEEVMHIPAEDIRAFMASALQGLLTPVAVDTGSETCTRKIPDGMPSAEEWAERFEQALAKNPSLATDRMAMEGWFANAICAGFDASIVAS